MTRVIQQKRWKHGNVIDLIFWDDNITTELHSTNIKK